MDLIGRQFGFLQTDSEECIKVLAVRGIEGIEGVAIRHAPQYSSQSQGADERYNLSVSEQVRTHRFVVETSYEAITVIHPYMDAMVHFQHGR